MAPAAWFNFPILTLTFTKQVLDSFLLSSNFKIVKHLGY